MPALNLAPLIIGHAALTDPQRGGAGVRLTVSPPRGGAVDVPALLDQVARVFPGPAPVLLNVADAAWLQALLEEEALPPHLVIELPGFLTADARWGERLLQGAQRGFALACSGREPGELPEALRPCFGWVVADLDGVDAPWAPGAGAAIERVLTGVRSMADLDRAFALGATRASGWPVDGPPVTPSKAPLAPEIGRTVELMALVDREEPAEKMEPLLKADPTLAFRLLRHINSPAFGLRVEVTSFKHALMLLGYARLKQWLRLLLASGSRDPAMRPLMRAAVYRGFVMEELGRGIGDDEARAEMFVCGIFSLLDRTLGQPLPDLLRSLPVPERVSQALLHDSGPHAPYLALVRAMERALPLEIRDRLDDLLLSPDDANRALFAGLTAAAQLP
jgi:EAL and modified HD-GYP domain-containing signal transduction protein